MSPRNENWGSSERLVTLQKCSPQPCARAARVGPAWRERGAVRRPGLGCSSRASCVALGDEEAPGSARRKPVPRGPRPSGWGTGERLTAGGCEQSLMAAA